MRAASSLSDYSASRLAALRIVASAHSITRDVQQSGARGASPAAASKSDDSPVTVADYAAQAFITLRLAALFPDDAFIAEETSDALRASPLLLSKVTAAVQVVWEATREEGEEAVTGEDVLGAIDLAARPAVGDGRRTWICDPIDGTIGYVNLRQYCVALALVHHGIPVIGVLGCPSLGPSISAPVSDCGTVFHAVRGGGTFSVSEDDACAGQLGTRVHVDSSTDMHSAIFCESVEASHSNHALSARVAARLGVKATPARMDSQAKYGAMARGDFHIFMRFPREGYVENVWDHAPAACIIEEAGGRVSDGRGRPLDFSKGRKLDNDDGIMASNGKLHDAVIDAIQLALSQDGDR